MPELLHAIIDGEFLQGPPVEQQPRHVQGNNAGSANILGQIPIESIPSDDPSKNSNIPDVAYVKSYMQRQGAGAFTVRNGSEDVSYTQSPVQTTNDLSNEGINARQINPPTGFIQDLYDKIKGLSAARGIAPAPAVQEPKYWSEIAAGNSLNVGAIDAPLVYIDASVTGAISVTYNRNGADAGVLPGTYWDFVCVGDNPVTIELNGTQTQVRSFRAWLVKDHNDARSLKFGTWKESL